MRSSSEIWRGRPARRHLRPLVLAVLCGAFLSLALMVPASPFAATLPIASAHSNLVKADPTPDSTVTVAPRVAHLWYSEALNPTLTKVRVLDSSSYIQVDKGDSIVLKSDARQMQVSIEDNLPAGNYLVLFTTQSAVDGHVTSDGYVFTYAPPGSTVQAATNVKLPPGGAAKTGNGTLDGPTIALTITTWLSFVLLAFWIGGVIWETWVLAPGLTSDSSLAAAAYAAERRFRRLAPYALGLLIAADVGIVLAQMGAIALATGQSNAFSFSVAGNILFGTRFGQFWWVRQIVAAAALALTLISARNRWQMRQAPTSAAGLEEALLADDGETGVPDFKMALLHTLGDVRRLPHRLADGLRHRSWVGRAELALALVLIIAFTLSGHAASSDDKALIANTVDFVHLIANSAWVGGLFYISLVLVPALTRLSPRQRARVLALGLPQFGALAIVAATLLASTGSLSTTVRLTSIQQFITTAYGWTLLVKIELFLLMVGISAYHAFILRPRLAHTLVAADAAAVRAATAAPSLVAAGSRKGRKAATVMMEAPARPVNDRLPPQAQALSRRISDWLFWEAVVGVAVLLCVALLSAFAGTLAVTPTAGSVASSAPPVAASSPTAAPASGPAAFTKTQKAGSFGVTLSLDTNAVGTNAVTVTVTDAKGNPVAGAAVVVLRALASTPNTPFGTGVQLKETGKAKPGQYTGSVDVVQPGAWDVTVKVLAPNADQFVQTIFPVTFK